MNPRPDDDQQLRDLLHDAVSDVEPRHGLDSIQARTKVTPMSARPWIYGVGGAVVATAATIVAFTVLADDTRPTAGPQPAEQPSVTAESPTVTDKGTPSEEPSQKAAAEDTVAVPVYYVGDTPQGPRLYREFHEATADLPDEEIMAAANAAVNGEPLDPDYHSPWPAGVTVTETAFSGSSEGSPITLGLRTSDGAPLSERPDGMSEAVAELAVQQLVYTATAAAQATPGVEFRVNGERTNQLLGVPVSEPLARADHLTTLSLVMVTTPAQGAVVEGSFRAEGIANSFEATVPWQILDGDKVVREGFSTAEGWMDKMYPWTSDPIDVSGLEPGEYTFVARTDDPSGGAEGGGPFEDTKTITVR